MKIKRSTLAGSRQCAASPIEDATRGACSKRCYATKHNPYLSLRPRGASVTVLNSPRVSALVTVSPLTIIIGSHQLRRRDTVDPQSDDGLPSSHRAYKYRSAKRRIFMAHKILQDNQRNDLPSHKEGQDVLHYISMSDDAVGKSSDEPRRRPGHQDSCDAVGVGLRD
jgi:hypothetical protein